MSKSITQFTLLGFIILNVFGCDAGKNEEVPIWSQPQGANLIFDIDLNPEIYRLSNFGEPPQMALWIENLDASEVKTLWVSSRLARGVWVGKVVCPTALPYWISRRDIESGGGLPSFLKPLPDGITGATPKEVLKVYASVEPGSEWKYFLELNVSGDYNDSFKANQMNGSPDPDGNGQPSLIYSGFIKAIPSWADTSSILGRSEQMKPSSQLNPDLSGFTTAHRVLRELTVTYREERGVTHE